MPRSNKKKLLEELEDVENQLRFLEFGYLLEELQDVERTLAFGVNLNYSDGTYEGDVNDQGKPHGQGVWTHPDREVGRIYVGADALPSTSGQN